LVKKLPSGAVKMGLALGCRCLVVASRPATEETGAMGHEIESSQGIGLYLFKNKKKGKMGMLR
jgi:hypothetical protein